MTLSELILQVVTTNSGGAKMIQVVTEVMEWVANRDSDESEGFVTDISLDEFSEHDLITDKVYELEASGHLKILKYGFPISETVREKQFVYFPLEKPANRRLES